MLSVMENGEAIVILLARVERLGKSARSLFNCISVTDSIKINEQDKSIGIGPLYLQTEFEAI